MYCIKCGTENADNAKFCNMCGNLIQEGKAVQNEVKSTEVNQPTIQQPVYNHTYTTVSQNSMDYSRLGGWLAFIAYGNLVGVFGILIMGIWSVVTLAPLVKYSSIIVLSIILVLGICIFGVYWWSKLFVLIKNKDIRVLRFYEIYAIVYVGVELLSLLTNDFQKATLGRILVTIIGTLIVELYFRNSERVRAYFGTDEYIRLSLFAKGINSSQQGVTYVAPSNMQNVVPVRNNKVKYCSACKAPMTMEDIFCPKCGNKNKKSIVQADPTQGTISFCSGCGAKLLPDAEFCIKCGKAK